MRAVVDWLARSGRPALPFQRKAWRAYADGESGLIVAPTGTGKTLAAWMGPVIEALSMPTSDARPVGNARQVGNARPVGNAAPVGDARLIGDVRTVGDALPAGPRVLWITPLRALANDLVENLREPLAPLSLEWRVELRTGDTSASVRQRQRKRPPHALVTTPESLSILLSSADTHAQLRGVRLVVADEWHELIGTKRGVQLELGLAHLRALNPGLRTWGLSATLPNIDEALEALLGPGHRGRVVRAMRRKTIVVDSIAPRDVARFPWAGHLGMQLLPDILRAIDDARTTLLFTNTRSQAEIWYESLLRARPDLLTRIAIHHGSIDRKLRERIERSVAEGDLRCVVCTSSLDLGVDFSPVDQVIQLGSPKGIARLMQRAGRSGHRPGEPSRVLCVPTHAWELVEIAAARAAIDDNVVETRTPLRRSLDVLVQHLVTLASGPGIGIDAALAEVRSSHAFAEITDAEWQWAIDFITRGGQALQGYPQYRRVVIDAGRLRIGDAALARRHRLSIGTITSDAAMRLRWLKGGALGTIEETTIARMRPGDAFLFAGRTLELVRVKDMTAYVRVARRTKRIVPRWQGGRMPLSTELADAVLDLLTSDERRRHPEMRIAEPLLALQSAWSELPTPKTLLVEKHRTREGSHLFVFPFCGRLANEGLATLVATRWTSGRSATFTVGANDYGFELVSRDDIAVDETTMREVLSEAGLADDLLASVNVSEIARRQFRDIARIAGLVFVGYPGRSKDARQLQASSGLIYDVLARYDAGNLLLDQAQREVLDAQLEVMRMRKALARIARRRIVIREPVRLTPLAFPLWADRLQNQLVSTESWQERVERAARELEAAAREG